jgi:hypothetical protein
MSKRASRPRGNTGQGQSAMLSEPRRSWARALYIAAHAAAAGAFLFALQYLGLQQSLETSLLGAAFFAAAAAGLAWKQTAR